MKWIKDFWNIFFLIILITVFCLALNFFFPSLLVTEKTETETTYEKKETKVSISESELRARLIDSLENELKPLLIYKEVDQDSLWKEASDYWNKYWKEKLIVINKKDTAHKPVVYESVIDTSIVVKDSLNNTTDSTRVVSLFSSPMFLYPGSIHKVDVYHTYYNTTVTTTITKIKKSLFDFLEPDIYAGYGYFLKLGEFGFNISAGLRIHLIKIIKTIWGSE